MDSSRLNQVVAVIAAAVAHEHFPESGVQTSLRGMLFFPPLPVETTRSSLLSTARSATPFTAPAL